ncbi:FMN-binding negative transcriptional regulator [Pseudomonas sp. RIT-PI-S]|uniref:FMN-binding negative transcriptional regulator n=1 Tax=Pseudomonas sp. RIT-PI-S TaxID=3035295 RepID=UPI0021D7F4D1|nr:FMN-binding negative transcriptional regulator [Pseudomonas sp. RIT-PI-S]
MYPPSAFREPNAELNLEFIEACGLALLITHDSNGLQANPVPMLLSRNGSRATLQGHLAKANPQWHALAAGAPALVVFNGPDAYVSPGYYPSKAQNPAVVPTWNYVSVQARGTPEVFHDRDRLLALVTALTQRHEAPRACPWAVSDAPAAYLEGMLKAIVGFSIPIDHLEGKRKLSQNRTPVDQQGVIAALAANSRPADQELARAMAFPLPKPKEQL